jgi:bis(5'-nucleosyl)-tetraphosphatase (symmetrical)
MAVYAIGDVQGCYDPLQRLLDKLRFDPDQDVLWFAGDLINRGPQSLATVRLVYSLGRRAVVVLGNHDLTMLAAAAGHIKPKKQDTYDEILQAADREQLLDWLRRRPVLHHDAVLGFTLVHAGLAPQWDLPLALACAAELEAALQSPHADDFLEQMFGNKPIRWKDTLQGFERLRCITNYLTRMRYCTIDGALSFAEKGSPETRPTHLLPWFKVPWRKHAGLNIIFGHWASLGLYHEPGIYALDSGCVWGMKLSALCLDGENRGLLSAVDCG